jgi:hypothetical protein
MRWRCRSTKQVQMWRVETREKLQVEAIYHNPEEECVRWDVVFPRSHRLPYLLVAAVFSDTMAPRRLFVRSFLEQSSYTGAMATATQLGGRATRERTTGIECAEEAPRKAKEARCVFCDMQKQSAVVGSDLEPLQTRVRYKSNTRCWGNTKRGTINI